MIVRKEERPVVTREKMRDGTGIAKLNDFCAAESLPAKCRLASVITLEKGVMIGEHSHDDETEFCLILSGQGVTLNEGEETVVYPGDVTVTNNGSRHYMKNVQDEPLVMVALVVKD